MNEMGEAAKISLVANSGSSIEILATERIAREIQSGQLKARLGMAIEKEAGLQL